MRKLYRRIKMWAIFWWTILFKKLVAREEVLDLKREEMQRALKAYMKMGRVLGSQPLSAEEMKIVAGLVTANAMVMGSRRNRRTQDSLAFDVAVLARRYLDEKLVKP